MSDAVVTIAPPRTPWHRRPLGLRRRIQGIFTLGALGLASFLAITTYGLVRSNLLSQHEDASLSAAYANFNRFRRSLPSGLDQAVENLNANGVERFVINNNGEWSGVSAGFGEDVLPDRLKSQVLTDGQPSFMLVEVDGEVGLAVGINLPDLTGAYFEFFSLDDANDTLSNVALSLFLAATITTGLGALGGTLAARRAVRPVADASEAAKAIADGDLTTRLTPTEDPDLGVLAQSFNDMSTALQRRVERDARFASDVSHELRSPLTTLSASIEVMTARRHELPERAQAALDLLVSDVTRFRVLVEDLLEISRFDSGAIRLQLDDLQASQFVRNAIAVSSAPDLDITADERAERAIIKGDRRRLARVLANLIDNAIAYGAGGAEVSLEVANPPDEPISHLKIAVADHGPGVPEDERTVIFERFARGAAAGRRTGSEGAGLGLALVDEHVRLHGGRVWVEDRPDGEPGARFVIELPARDPIDYRHDEFGVVDEIDDAVDATPPADTTIEHSGEDTP